MKEKSERDKKEIQRLKEKVKTNMGPEETEAIHLKHV